MSVKLDYYCPICIGVLGYEISSSKIMTPICKSCGWKGDWSDCLDEDEAKNSKRVKVIDKMLK